MDCQYYPEPLTVRLQEIFHCEVWTLRSEDSSGESDAAGPETCNDFLLTLREAPGCSVVSRAMRDETARWASLRCQGGAGIAARVTCVRRALPAEGRVSQHSVCFPRAPCNLSTISDTGSPVSGTPVQTMECKRLSPGVLYVSFHALALHLCFPVVRSPKLPSCRRVKLLLLLLVKKKKIWNIKYTPVIHQSSIIKQKGWLAKINANTNSGLGSCVLPE